MTEATAREIELLASKILRDWARVQAMSTAKEEQRLKRKEQRDERSD